jgi:hypothetical protein
MGVPLAVSVVDLLLGLEVGTSGDAARNRCSLEGLAWKKSGDPGVLELTAQALEATSLRLATGEWVLEIGRVDLRQLTAQVHADAGAPGLSGLSALKAAEAELSGVRLQGPLAVPPQMQAALRALQGTGGGTAPEAAAAAGAWSLGPLGAAEGTIRGRITDAHLLFDADVTVPLRHGQIDFNDATVEHVGPDSRMGVSRLGLYVDAPNGRSYLYQFASAPIAGVEFERRGALLSPWVSERGKLHLQPFAEAMLRQCIGGAAQGLTEQARLLLGRTALSGQVQLGDGLLAVPGAQARMKGRAEGRNAIGLSSEALGRGLAAEMPSFSATDAAATWKGAQLACDSVTARLKLQLLVEGAHMRFAIGIDDCKLAGLRVERLKPPAEGSQAAAPSGRASPAG